jgi:hypothetical protein
LNNTNSLLLDLLVAVSGKVLQKMSAGRTGGVPQQADQWLHCVLLNDPIAIFLDERYVSYAHGLYARYTWHGL